VKRGRAALIAGMLIVACGVVGYFAAQFPASSRVPTTPNA